MSSLIEGKKKHPVPFFKPSKGQSASKQSMMLKTLIKAMVIKTAESEDIFTLQRAAVNWETANREGGENDRFWGE